MRRMRDFFVIMCLLLLSLNVCFAATSSQIGPMSGLMLSCSNSGNVSLDGSTYTIQALSHACSSGSAAEMICRSQSSIIFAGVCYEDPSGSGSASSQFNLHDMTGEEGTYFKVEAVNWFFFNEGHIDFEFLKNDAEWFMQACPTSCDGIFRLSEDMYLYDGFASNGRSFSIDFNNLSKNSKNNIQNEINEIKLNYRSKITNILIDSTKGIVKNCIEEIDNDIYNNNLNLYHYFELDNIKKEFVNCSKAEQLIEFMPIHYLSSVIKNKDIPPVIWTNANKNKIYYSVIREDGTTEVYESVWVALKNQWSDFNKVK